MTPWVMFREAEQIMLQVDLTSFDMTDRSAILESGCRIRDQARERERGRGREREREKERAGRETRQP